MTTVNDILLKVNLHHLANQLKLYLYGDPSINNSDNKNIHLMTIRNNAIRNNVMLLYL